MHRLVNIIDTKWRPELAYAVGLVASDGHLRKDNKGICFVSKDRELIDKFRESIALKKEPYRSGRGGTTKKNYWTVQFKSRNFHDFLVSIGVTPKKSKTIKAVQVPNSYFADFLRGLFDGDGTFWTTWDKRWPRSFVYYLGFSTASPSFVRWLKKRIADQFKVKGYIHNGDGVFTIRYVKGDSRKLFKAMYYRKGLLYLSRKYLKIKKAIDYDERLKDLRIQQRSGTIAAN